MDSREHQTAANRLQRFESTTSEDPFSGSVRKQFVVRKKCSNIFKFETVALILMITTNIILLVIMLPMISSSLTKLDQLESKYNLILCVSKT